METRSASLKSSDRPTRRDLNSCQPKSSLPNTWPSVFFEIKCKWIWLLNVRSCCWVDDFNQDTAANEASASENELLENGSKRCYFSEFLWSSEKVVFPTVFRQLFFVTWLMIDRSNEEARITGEYWSVFKHWAVAVEKAQTGRSIRCKLQSIWIYGGQFESIPAAAPADQLRFPPTRRAPRSWVMKWLK